MPTITFSVSKELKRGMDEFPEINWSKVACEGIREQVKKIESFKLLVSKSKLTKKDALEIGRKISKELHERYKRLEILDNLPK